MTKLLTASQLAEMLGFSETSIWPAIRRLEKKGFPKKINVTARTVRWRLSEVEAWLERQQDAA